MKEALCKYLREKKLDLTEDQMIFWFSLLTERKIKRGEFLLREGEVEKRGSFVVKGCLRLYSIDEKGRDHIIQFAPENWWIRDMESYAIGTPSNYFIDAVEDSEILLMDKTAEEKLMKKIPSLALFFQNLLFRRQIASQKRINATMSATADERYLDFIKTYPSLAMRLPQHMIASYLGITPESLSRVRKSISKKKN